MAELWVGNIRADASPEELVEVFSRFGTVEKAVLKTSDAGRPYAFVRFQEQAHAAAATAQLNGVQVPELTETQLEMRWSNQSTRSGAGYKAQPRAPGVQYEEVATEVWVGNLLPGVTSAQVLAYFQSVVPCVIMAEAGRGPPSGGRDYAFVGVAHEEEVALLRAQEGVVVPELTGSQPLVIKPARRFRGPAAGHSASAGHGGSNSGAPGKQGGYIVEVPRPPTHEHAAATGSDGCAPGFTKVVRGYVVGDSLPASPTLWVGNISGAATVSEMLHLFARFGSVQSCQLFPAPGMRYQFAFVHMSSAQEAAQVLKELNALETLDICSDKRLKIRFAVKRGGMLKVGAANGMGGHTRGAQGPQQSWAAVEEECGEEGYQAGSLAATQPQPLPPPPPPPQQQQQQGWPRARATSTLQQAAALSAAPPPLADLRCCAQCGSTSSKLAKCTGCLAITYCSRDCQLADWDSHRPDCNRLRALGGLLAAAQPGAAQLLHEALRHPGSNLARMVESVVSQAATAAASAFVANGHAQ